MSVHLLAWRVYSLSAQAERHHLRFAGSRVQRIRLFVLLCRGHFLRYSRGCCRVHCETGAIATRICHSSSFQWFVFIPCIVFPVCSPEAGVAGQLAFSNSKGADALARASVQISSNAGFAVFFGLDFSGKVALVQLWIHTARLHNNGSSNPPLRLQSTCTRCYEHTKHLW
jgi:hypothetical protein